MPFAEIDELRAAVVEGRERGYLTPDEIAVTLEDADPTREQVVELHQYLIENGIDVTDEAPVADGEPATASARPAARPLTVPKKAELDLTVEPSLDSLRLYL